MLTVPKISQGKVIEEEQMAYIFASSKGALTREQTSISDPQKLMVARLPSVGRKYNLVFDDGTSMQAFSFYFNAGNVNFLFGACFNDSKVLDAYKDIFLHMAESLQFTYTISQPDPQQDASSSQEDSLEDSFKELGQAFDELLKALSE